MQAIVESVRQQALPVEICAVVSNVRGAPGLTWAAQEAIQTQVVPHGDYPTREAFDQALGDAIERYQADYVLLAGFMRLLTPGFVERFNDRIINIHPSLLPAFPGLSTHEQALAAGVQWHGCTVHFVTSALDHGPIIAQGAVPILSSDTVETLSARVLDIEHRLYTSVVRWLAEGRVTLDPLRRVQVRGVICRSFLAASDDMLA